MSDVSNIQTVDPLDANMLVAIEVLVPSKLHQQMIQICDRRRASLNDTLLDLISRFMPGDVTHQT